LIGKNVAEAREVVRNVVKEKPNSTRSWSANVNAVAHSQAMLAKAAGGASVTTAASHQKRAGRWSLRATKFGQKWHATPSARIARTHALAFAVRRSSVSR
jgi:hypothetical protein